MITVETRRQLVHLGVLVFALPVPLVGPVWATVLCGAAVLFNWVVLPLTGQDRLFRREGERFLNGVRVYPVAVLMLVVFFPLTIAQGAWACLAVGDCFSNLFGRRFGRVKLPWNRRKSWAGTVGFAATAFPGALLLMLYSERCAPGAALLEPWRGAADLGGAGVVLLLAAVGALAGAVLESLPTRLDDNLTVSLGTAATMAGVALLAAA